MRAALIAPADLLTFAPAFKHVAHKTLGREVDQAKLRARIFCEHILLTKVILTLLHVGKIKQCLSKILNESILLTCNLLLILLPSISVSAHSKSPSTAVMASPQLTLPLAKFSFATTSQGYRAPIPWTHLISENNLVAIFELTPSQNSRGSQTLRHRFKIINGQEILVQYAYQRRSPMLTEAGRHQPCGIGFGCSGSCIASTNIGLNERDPGDRYYHQVPLCCRKISNRSPSSRKSDVHQGQAN